MRRSITWQLGRIIVGVIFVSIIITTISNYWVSYRKTYEAAGIEAVGCANITTGLIDPNDIEKIINGDKGKLREVQEKLDWTTDHKQIFETQYVLLLDGTILAADSNLQKQGFQAGDQFYIDEEIIKMIEETKHPHYSNIYEYGGMKRITGYAPIFKDHDPNNEIIAINAIDFNAKIVAERTWDAVKSTLLLGLVPMLLAGIITLWLLYRKTRPIKVLIDYAKKISEGDLSVKKVKTRNTDEMDDLANTLNVMAQNLREIIYQVNISAEQVSASSEQLTANAEQTNHETEKIVSIVNEMSMSVEKQVQSVEKTSKTIHTMSKDVQQIATNAQHVSSITIETSEKAFEGCQSVQLAVKQMESINKTVSSLGEIIRVLGERSNEISQIIEVIEGIAEQTNLLALNATIEAARAGEHGRGFAVVAKEVRKLAEQSAQSAKDISHLIFSIQKETNKVIHSMENVTEEVVGGIEMISSAGQFFEHIQNSISEVSYQIQEVSSAVQQIAAGSEQLVHSMDLINEVSELSASITQKVSTSTERQLASMQEISSSATYLSKMAEELHEIIGKFKIA